MADEIKKVENENEEEEGLFKRAGRKGKAILGEWLVPGACFMVGALTGAFGMWAYTKDKELSRVVEESATVLQGLAETGLEAIENKEVTES